ncbi:hypothetical protein MSAN_00206300 [Mycena sanguinolenta]|uniref:F-box domain-containing protein n=1 Tax=Mycena sanguinolenta TaxID=230812 RepID=A0A8H6ZF30_9AGAR|nr:hypothetical protein MSAN_00206300 [Mycena sanguinolenta]
MLAQELIDAIIDKVPRNKLTTCSLVAKSFLVPSQQRLFASLSLFTAPLRIAGPPKGEQILAAFENAVELFTMSPHLSKYVRSLALCLTPSLRNFGAVESVLRTLPKLRSICFLANAHHGVAFNWQEMPASVKSLLKDFIVHPTLRHLSFSYMAGIPSSIIIHAASSLHSLSFFGTSAQDHPESTSHISGSYDSLRALSITAVADPVHPWVSVFDLDIHQYLRGLRDFSLTICRNAYSSDWSPLLLESNAPTTLQYLKLAFQFPLPILDFPSFPALQELEIVFQVGRPTLPLELSDLLVNVATAAPLLESLSFKVETTTFLRMTYMWTGDSEPYSPFGSPDFAKQLPHLRRLHWSRNTGNAFDDGFEDYIGKKFPGPREAKILTFSSTE